MTDEQPASVPVTRGTEDEIIAKLSALSPADTDPVTVATAVRQIRQGYRVVELCGERFQILEPDWSLVQDVYGCEKGRDCTSVTSADRHRFEAMIADRTKTGD